jgi:hypothetical protein
MVEHLTVPMYCGNCQGEITSSAQVSVAMAGSGDGARTWFAMRTVCCSAPLERRRVKSPEPAEA